jgi:hypothetical protein
MITQYDTGPPATSTRRRTLPPSILAPHVTLPLPLDYVAEPTLVGDSNRPRRNSTLEPPENSAKNVPSRKRKITPEKAPLNAEMDYAQFFKENVNLNKYKIVELKEVAKYNRLHITGNKTVLVGRITNYFLKHRYAILIQKYLRRFFVKRSFQLRGAALHNRSICINETDFFTLEPLGDIPFQEFYSYTDANHFTYGFNICSLITLLKRQGRAIMNPYNRSKIPENIIGDVIRLYIYVIILFPQHINPEDQNPLTRHQYIQYVSPYLMQRGYYYGFTPRVASHMASRRIREELAQSILGEDDDDDDAGFSLARPVLNNHVIALPAPTILNESPNPHNNFNAVSAEVMSIAERLSREVQTLRDTTSGSNVRRNGRASAVDPSANPEVVHLPIQTRAASRASTESTGIRVLSPPATFAQIEHINQMKLRIESMREKPLNQRIQEVFMEIDQLGNYTDAQWYINLNMRQKVGFYGFLQDLWRFRGRLSNIVKQRICPLGDPFQNLLPNRVRFEDISLADLTNGSVSVMENLVFTAYDIEDRRLGALYVLFALTMVSLPARNNMMWLFEAVI